MIRYRIAAVIAALLIAGGALCTRTAAQTPAATVDLWTVRQNLDTAISLAEQGGDGYQHDIDLLIDQTLHLLRSPKPGGDGYNFASMDADKAETILLNSTKVDAVLEQGQVQKLSGEIATPVELEIFSPSQRAAFKNNGDTFIKGYRVEIVMDGAKKTVERKFEDWLRRGTSHTIPLPGVAQWARIEIDVAVHKADVNHSIVKLRARVPHIVDDPMNPYSFSIDELKLAREYNKLAAKRGVVKEKLRSALKGLDMVPGASGQASPPPLDVDQLIAELDHVLFLLGGTDSEKADARSRLSEIIDELKQKQ